MPIQQSNWYWNNQGTQRAVVIYADGWTYILDNNNQVVHPPIPAQNQYTQFSQRLTDAGYTTVGAPHWNLPPDDPPRG
jgi:hypothetical protein